MNQRSRLLVFLGSLFFVLTASGASYADAPPNQLTEAERRGGWKLLFDGETTNGWRNYQSDALNEGWVAKGGALRRVKRGAGTIITVDKFENFELSLEYQISPGGNSGIMFHVEERESPPYKTGPEVQILDNRGQRREMQQSGWLYDLYKPTHPDWQRKFERAAGRAAPDQIDATRPAGEWNHVYLRVADQSEVVINGVHYYEFSKGSEDWNRRVAASKFADDPDFGKVSNGHIALQDHGKPVAFRNVKIRLIGKDGSVPDPVDGQLPLQGVEAFGWLTWEGWQPVDDRGLVNPIRPLILTHAGDGSNRIFVATQGGMIHVFDNDPQVAQTKLFLDLRSKVIDWHDGFVENEEGLLGMAFHPDYKNNGQFFVYYTPADKPRRSVISRFQVSSADPDRADPDSEEVILEREQPFDNHNGGAIEFGPDGFLYIAFGDGGHRNDLLNHGQNLGSWLGSILRIDVSRKENGRNYAIPADNPFLDRPHARPEIYAYGFRNIWQFAFDRKTGDLWAGDVGQDLWEEINIVRRGGNYGWSIREGTHLFGNRQGKIQDEPIDPIWEYDHRVGKSITGGRVYRGSRLSELEGHYLYADYVAGKIWALQYDDRAGKVLRNLSIPSDGALVFGFGEDEQGEIYYMTQSANGRSIYRLERTEE